MQEAFQTTRGYYVYLVSGISWYQVSAKRTSTPSFVLPRHLRHSTAKGTVSVVYDNIRVPFRGPGRLGRPVI